MDQGAFLKDTLTYDATLRNLELIGEAATHIPDAVREIQPEIPWRTIVATRNRVAHEYLGIDNDVVWDITQNDILETDTRDNGGSGLMYKYEVILYWSHVDDAFVTEAPELPGCMAHGDTPEAALEHIHQAMDLWIDTAREFCDPVPEPKGKPLRPA